MKNINSYIFPGLLVLAGLVLLINGGSAGQNMWFMIGGLALLITGAVSILFQLGILNRRIGTLLGILFLLASVVLAYRNVETVKEDIRYTELKDKVNKHIVQGLKDIRTAQIGYRSTYGRYTRNGDSLVHFLKNGKLNVIKAIGQLPDTLSEEEAIELGIIQRDTIQVPSLDSLFLSPHVQEGRLFPFDLDSLPYARLTGGKKFEIEAGGISSSGRNVPVFRATEPDPMEPDEQILTVGSMDKASTSGNWSGE